MSVLTPELPRFLHWSRGFLVMSDLLALRNDKIVDGTHYHAGTPDVVIDILERSRRERLRIVITYGNTATGEVWEDATPNRGYVGRSTGNMKIPLLIRTGRSLGGEALLDHCIVRIRESKGGRVLYGVRV